MKKCSKCGIEKPLSREFFHVRSSSKDGFKPRCKECRQKDGEIYYVENKEEILKKHSEYKKANKEVIAIKNKQYREDNKLDLIEYRRNYYANNKEYFQMYIRTPDVGRQRTQRYRARKRKLPNTLTIKQWDTIKKDFNNSCAYCGAVTELAQDHFIPLSKGGEYTHNNIIPSCRSCNSSKSNKDFFEWYQNYKCYSERREKFILEYLGYTEDTQQLSIL